METQKAYEDLKTAKEDELATVEATAAAATTVAELDLARPPARVRSRAQIDPHDLVMQQPERFIGSEVSIRLDTQATVCAVTQKLRCWSCKKQIRYDRWLAFDECEEHELSAIGELLPIVEPVDALVAVRSMRLRSARDRSLRFARGLFNASCRLGVKTRYLCEFGLAIEVGRCDLRLRRVWPLRWTLQHLWQRSKIFSSLRTSNSRRLRQLAAAAGSKCRPGSEGAEPLQE